MRERDSGGESCGNVVFFTVFTAITQAMIAVAAPIQRYTRAALPLPEVSLTRLVIGCAGRIFGSLGRRVGRRLIAHVGKQCIDIGIG